MVATFLTPLLKLLNPGVSLNPIKLAGFVCVCMSCTGAAQHTSPYDFPVRARVLEGVLEAVWFPLCKGVRDPPGPRSSGSFH